MKRRTLITALLTAGGAGAAGLLGAGYFTGTARSGAPAAGTVGDGVIGPQGMVWVPAGQFLMGSDSTQARRNEMPAHPTRVSGFWADIYDVTNADFARFVAATGYVTTAERKPEWSALQPQLPPGTPEPDPSVLVPGGMVFVGTDAPVSLDDWSRWWAFVPGANWRQPQGPGSSIDGKERYPVTQVSHEDALAYAHWTGRRLPTEAQWEFAARGGLEQADYAWGNELKPDGKKMANAWDDSARQFPVVGGDGQVKVGTTPVGSFPANGYGLYDMSGNVWQWCADWYRADAFVLAAQSGMHTDPDGPASSWDPEDPGVPVNAPKRVMRGGSFLCSEDYCTSYRASARRGTDPYTSMSHLGFRTVMSQEAWLASKARSKQA